MIRSSASDRLVQQHDIGNPQKIKATLHRRLEPAGPLGQARGLAQLASEEDGHRAGLENVVRPEHQRHRADRRHEPPSPSPPRARARPSGKSPRRLDPRPPVGRSNPGPSARPGRSNRLSGAYGLRGGASATGCGPGLPFRAEFLQSSMSGTPLRHPPRLSPGSDHPGATRSRGVRVMIGFGALVKSFAKALDQAGMAAWLGLRLGSQGRRPKPCPIPVAADRPRRRR